MKTKAKLIAHTMGINNQSPSDLLKHAFSQCYQKTANIDVVLRNLKHESVLEHITFMFDVTCSRSCLAQLTRHRIASYTVQSHRYTEPEFIISHMPEELENNDKASMLARGMIESCIDYIEKTYKEVRDLGFAKQIARMVAPHCIPVNLTMSINLRSLINFLQLRTSTHAEEEIRCLAHQVAGEIAPAFTDAKELYFKILEMGGVSDV